MNIIKYWALIIIFTQLTYCTFESPEFTIDGECLKVDRNLWFQNLSIENTTSEEFYLIKRDPSLVGSHIICLPIIPDGYFVLIGKDTIANNLISINYGDTIIINNFGGHRGNYNVKCIYRSSKIEVIEK